MQAPVAAALVYPQPATLLHSLPPAMAATEASAPASDVDKAYMHARADVAPARVNTEVATDLLARLLQLSQSVAGRLLAQGFPRSSIVLELLVNLRYQGTDTAIMTPCFVDSHITSSCNTSAGSEDSQLPLDSVVPNLESSFVGAVAEQMILAAILAAPGRFVASYRREFGFVLLGRAVLVDDVRVRGTARSATPLPPVASDPVTEATLPASHVSVYFGQVGRVQTPVYQLASMRFGHRIPGPALLVDPNTTIVVEPGFTAAITRGGDVEMFVEEELPLPVPLATPPVATAAAAAIDGVFPDIPAEPVQLSCFGHRFMGIAEQMGRVLQRTSISVNIRERLDFSCALFGPTGGLVANAPHIPVHLGAMQEAVRYQVRRRGKGDRARTHTCSISEFSAAAALVRRRPRRPRRRRRTRVQSPAGGRVGLR
jgi:5-oxoprolinase (ATP-hydrolysing)